jgi:hypothetical protein
MMLQELVKDIVHVAMDVIVIVLMEPSEAETFDT